MFFNGGAVNWSNIHIDSQHPPSAADEFEDG